MTETLPILISTAPTTISTFKEEGMAKRWKEGRCDYSASQRRRLSFEEPIDLELKKKSKER